MAAAQPIGDTATRQTNRTIDPAPPVNAKAAWERYLAKWCIITERGCWEWQRYRIRTGYGQVGRGLRTVLTHRFVFEVFSGTDPGELKVCHRCDNPPCCNPAHLFLATQTANLRDMVNKNRQQAGERHCFAKLTDANVREIRQIGRTLTLGEIAERFGVKPMCISSVLTGKSWKGVQ